MSNGGVNVELSHHVTREVTERLPCRQHFNSSAGQMDVVEDAFVAIRHSIEARLASSFHGVAGMSTAHIVSMPYR